MKKFITIATALAISLVAVGSANAQTAEELQAQIAQLQAMIAQLTSQLGTTTTTTTTGTTSIPAVCSGITFTRNLTIGSRGADVKCLQALLNQDPATQLAATGAGSPGQETDYFGPITKAAVIKFQEKYASEVLTPLGLTKGTGYVGNSTIAKLNSILSSASVIPTTPTYTPTPTPEPYTPPVTGEEEEEEEEEEELSGGEGDITNWKKLGDPSNEEVEEGDSNHKVLGVSFEADGSDLKLNRVKVYFSKKSGKDGSYYRPWQYFEKVSLYLGDKKIAEKNANQDNWSQYDDSGDDGFKDYAITFTGLNEIIREGNKSELYVAVTVKDDLDSKNEDTVWNVWIPANGIRFTDAVGLNVYAPDKDTDATETFKTTSSTPADVTLSYDSNVNGNRMIDGDKDNSTSDVEVLRFTLEAEDNEALLKDLKIRIEGKKPNTNLDISKAVSNVKLYKDGKQIGGSESVEGNTGNYYVTFKDLDLTLPEDEELEFVVKAQINRLSTDFPEGSYIKFTIDCDDNEDLLVENNAGDTINVDGKAEGGQLYVYDKAIAVNLISTDAKRTSVADDSGEADQGTFTMEFTVKALDSTVYIPMTAAEETSATSTDGIVYALKTDNNNETAIRGAGLSAVLDSEATEDGDFYKITKGRTETFTLTVNANGALKNSNVRIILKNLRWGTEKDLDKLNDYNFFSENVWKTKYLLLNVK